MLDCRLESNLLHFRKKNQLFILQNQSLDINNRTKTIAKKLVCILFLKKKRKRKYKFNNKFI